MWRGGLGSAYLLPTLSSVGASLTPPCFRFHTRSSNRTCGFADQRLQQSRCLDCSDCYRLERTSSGAGYSPVDQHLSRRTR
jgi:hypothetical protein